MTELQVKLLNTLDKRREGITGEELAAEFRVSLNTVRKELNIIKDLLPEQGLELHARPSYGYRIVVTEEEKAVLFLDHVHHMYSNPLMGRQSSSDYKRNYIVRRLLTSRKSLPLEILCEELFYSNSSLRRELKTIEDDLKRFDLKLSLKRGEGYFIEGSEWMKRLCLLNQHRLFVNLDRDLQSREPDMVRTFLQEDYYMRCCRHAIRDRIMESSVLSFKMINLPVVTYYLPLIVTRRQYAKDLKITEKQKRLIRESGMLEQARDLLAMAGQKYRMTIDETEIETYACLLEAFRCITDLDELQESEKALLEREVDELADAMAGRLNFRRNLTGQLRDQFARRWYEIRSHVILHVVPDEEEVHQTVVTDLFAEDLCIELARYLSRRYDWQVPTSLTFYMYYTLHQLVQEKMRSGMRNRAIVISAYGYQYAEQCAERIRKHYHSFLREVLPIEYTQRRLIDPSRFNLLITDMRTDVVEDYLKNIPGMTVMQVDLNEIAEGQYRKLDSYIDRRLAGHASLRFHERTLETAGKSKTSDPLADLLKQIVADVQPCDPTGFLHGLQVRLDYQREKPRDGQLILSLHAPAEHAGVRTYELTSPVTYRDEKVNRILLCLYNNEDMYSLYVLNMLLEAELGS